MLEAMEKELHLRQHELKNRKIKSIYFGGGTPSLVSAGNLQKFIDQCAHYFDLDQGLEITVECNPDDLSKEYLKQLTQTQTNRLSIGTQSFYQQDLEIMNRAHTAQEAEDSIKRAQDFGLENISIDLIYGSPVSGIEVWKENLQKTTDLGVKHVSAYALTVEPKTQLEHQIQTRKILPPDEDLQSQEFEMLREHLENTGFDHYEISNFGKPGFHSRHNSAYWQNLEYLGIGPSAHSFDGLNRRSWNVANNAIYLKKISGGELALQTEVLTEKEMMNEHIMIGLRTAKGMNLIELGQRISGELFSKLKAQMDQKIADGELIMEGEFLKIEKKHWFHADGIAADLFQI